MVRYRSRTSVRFIKLQSSPIASPSAHCAQPHPSIRVFAVPLDTLNPFSMLAMELTRTRDNAPGARLVRYGAPPWEVKQHSHSHHHTSQPACTTGCAGKHDTHSPHPAELTSTLPRSSPPNGSRIQDCFILIKARAGERRIDMT